MLDWIQFHKDLDTALATYIMDNPDNRPSNPIMDFLQFSHGKSIEASGVTQPSETSDEHPTPKDGS